MKDFPDWKAGRTDPGGGRGFSHRDTGPTRAAGQSGTPWNDRIKQEQKKNRGWTRLQCISFTVVQALRKPHSWNCIFKWEKTQNQRRTLLQPVRLAGAPRTPGGWTTRPEPCTPRPPGVVSEVPRAATKRWPPTRGLEQLLFSPGHWKSEIGVGGAQPPHPPPRAWGQAWAVPLC